MLALIETFLQVATVDTGRIAVKDHLRHINYGQLVNKVDTMAKWLVSYGLVKGDRVGIHLPNSIEYIILYYACWRAGYVPVAFNTLATQSEIEFWLNDCECNLIFSNKLKSIHDSVVLCNALYVENENSLRIDNVVIDDKHHNFKFSSVSLDDVATIIYTSGTTGSPKGITLLHRNVAVNIYAIIKSLNILKEDDFLCVLPFYYSFGNSILHSHLVTGSTLVLLNQVMYPAEILKTIEQEKCSGFAGVPSLYISLLKKTDFRKFDLTSLRYVTQAGGPLAYGFIEQIRTLIPDTDFVVMYGQTEASARISYLPPEYLEQKPGSVGIAVEGLDISILDKSENVCKPDEVGEICVQGENIMSGYWKNIKATGSVLINHKLHTGDIGYKDRDGFLYIVGRQSEILKISEHRVSPYEIEEVILRYKSVEECAVIGCSHHQSGQFVKAYIVNNSGDIGDRTLKKFCKRYLAAYKIPKEIIFVDSLPKTSSGKIKRNQLLC